MSALVSPFRTNLLAGRVALITGGASGIGLEIARQFGRHGSKLIIMGRRQNFLDAAVEEFRKEGLQVESFAGDVRVPEDADRAIKKAIDTFGSLDTVVNSAAGNFLALPEKLSTNGFRTVMDIDAVGVFNISRAAFEPLKTSGNGVIINISATLHYGATWYQAHASAAKAAIDSLTRSLGLEWGQYGIRVVGIAPGPIAETPGMTKLAPGVDAQTMEAALGAAIPLGRMGTKTDIANAALFLASEAASYVTGETLVVDGAAWMFKPPQVPREIVSEIARSVESKSRSVGGAAPTPKL